MVDNVDRSRVRPKSRIAALSKAEWGSKADCECMSSDADSRRNCPNTPRGGIKATSCKQILHGSYTHSRKPLSTIMLFQFRRR